MEQSDPERDGSNEPIFSITSPKFIEFKTKKELKKYIESGNKYIWIYRKGYSLDMEDRHVRELSGKFMIIKMETDVPALHATDVNTNNDMIFQLTALELVKNTRIFPRFFRLNLNDNYSELAEGQHINKSHSKRKKHKKTKKHKYLRKNHKKTKRHTYSSHKRRHHRKK